MVGGPGLSVLAFVTAWHCVNVNSQKGILIARNTTTTTRFCIEYAIESNISTGEDDAKFYSLAIPSGWDACTPNETLDLTSKVVLVTNSSCRILTKVYTLQSEGAAGLIVEEIGGNDTVVFTNNSTQKNESISIPVIFVDVEVAKALKGMEPNVTVAVFAPPTFVFDYSLVATWVVAVFCVVVGSYWCGVSYYNMLMNRDKSHRLKRSRVGSEQQEHCSSADHMQMKLSYINAFMIIALVVMMCVFLLSLYYFYKYLVYVIIALFFVASTSAVFQIIDAMIHKIFYNCQPWRLPECTIKGYHFSIEYTQVLLAVGCLALSTYWLYIRNDITSWIVQDILGTFFCINVLRIVRLPNMMVLTLLMTLLFIYDVFFVFITPYLTKSGESIMVQVATGGSTHDEKLPMLFKFPHFENPLSECRLSGFSILGFGDILIPGLTVSFVHGFDLEVGSKRVYFISSVIAYGIGLLLTFIGIFMMETAQPALLYLVPCVLINIYAVACIRHEVKAIWTGRIELDNRSSPDSIVKPSESATAVAGIPEAGDSCNLLD